MAIKFNPLTGNFDFTGSGGGGGSAFFAGEVATYADLPLDGAAALNSRWLVRTNSGTWPFSSYKQSGIYIRTATVGSSRDNDYKLTDTSFHDVMSDDAFLIFDNTDPTKAAKFDVGAQVGANQTRVITVPNKNITLDDAGDSRTPASHTHGNLTNAGAIGSTANLPLKTGTNGVVEAGSFGTAAGSFCAGNDARLSDARTPTAHAASHLVGTPAIAASYTGIGDNESFSEEVTITANTAGTAGNSITLTFDGVDDVDTVLAAWNAANPSNQATLDSGDGAQVPDNGDELTLSGGVAAIAGGSDPIYDQDLNTDDEVQFAKINGPLANGGFDNLTITNGQNAILAIDNTEAAAFAMFLVDTGNNNATVGQVMMGLRNGTEAFLQNGSPTNNELFRMEKSGGNLADLIVRKLKLGDGTDVATIETNISSNVTLTVPNQSGTLALTTDNADQFGSGAAVDGYVLTADGAGGAAWEAATGGSGVTAVGASTADVLSVSGSDLVADDPNADRIVFWDDSESKLRYLEAGSGLSISGTTMTATASGGSKTYAVFTAEHNQPPATAFATLDTRNSIAVLDFDAATDESAVFVGIIPEGASLGSGLKVFIHWMASTATSGNCRWGVQFEKSGTDLDSDSFDTATEAHSAANGTSGIETVTEITATAIDSLAAGNRFRLKVFRNADDATNDTMTGDAELVAVEIRSAA